MQIKQIKLLLIYETNEGGIEDEQVGANCYLHVQLIQACY